MNQSMQQSQDANYLSDYCPFFAYIFHTLCLLALG